MRLICCSIILLPLISFGQLFHKEKMTTNFDNGNIKLKITERHALIGKYLHRKEFHYYENGKLESKEQIIYRKPVEKDDATDPGKKFSLIKKKHYKIYTPTGILVEKASLHFGAGKTKEYDSLGKLARIKNMEHFVPIETIEVSKK